MSVDRFRVDRSAANDTDGTAASQGVHTDLPEFAFDLLLACVWTDRDSGAGRDFTRGRSNFIDEINRAPVA